MSEILPPHGVFISKPHEKDSSLKMYEVPIPATTFAAIEKSRLKPVHNLDEMALLMRERSFGLFRGFAVISQETTFGVHIDYIHYQDGSLNQPFFSLKIIPHQILEQMGENTRAHIITCINDARALKHFEIVDGFIIESPEEKVA